MDAVSELLAVTAKWAKRCGLSDEQVCDAQTVAWYLWREAEDYPASVFARWAVKRVRSRRSLPGCGTSPSDALEHSWTCGLMAEVLDKEPSPDVLVDHAERFARALETRSLKHRQVAALKIQGATGQQIAAALNVSPGRVAQIGRELYESFMAE